MTTVVSGWHPEGYNLYGKNFIDTFQRYWPESIDLLCYTEEPVALPRGECRSLWDCEGAREFIERHMGNPAHCGLQQTPCWRAKDLSKGYNFRTDAVKFFKQLMIPGHAAETLPDGELLVWLDADVVTFKAIPNGFVEDLIASSDLVFLGRNGTHSEIGFWAVRINPVTRLFLAGLGNMYRNDDVFGLREYHSAFVFDHVRQRFEQVYKMKARNLTPNGQGHVWFQSPLKRYCDHLKGRRKNAGRSTERTA